MQSVPWHSLMFMKFFSLEEIIAKAILTFAKERVARNGTFAQNVMEDTFQEVASSRYGSKMTSKHTELEAG